MCSLEVTRVVRFSVISSLIKTKIFLMQYKELRKAIGPVLLELKLQCFSIKFTTLSLHYLFLQKNMNSSFSLNM